MTFVSIVRLWYLVHFKADDVDPTWHYLDICLWSTVEINVGIWCLCVPTVRIMFLYGRKQYMKWKARSGQDGRSVHDKNSRAHNCASQSDSGTRGIRLQDMSTQPSWYSEHTENDAAMAVSPLQVGDASRV